ncbi:hypothetical protein COLO4_32396 [Corchorus olitorius]|uniref:ARID domain-containing protein n=1 Tax=Corchorus olitorius TaxID=93759 RepID=A0A1R3GZG9_9ROSI|nr:hypothetical protein COLO4_32396 [Corchorus olitorius]
MVKAVVKEEYFLKVKEEPGLGLESHVLMKEVKEIKVSKGGASFGVREWVPVKEEMTSGCTEEAVAQKEDSKPEMSFFSLQIERGFPRERRVNGVLVEDGVFLKSQIATMDTSKWLTYQELRSDKKIFRRRRMLGEFWNGNVKIPRIDGSDVDLHQLFRAMTLKGGYNRVTAENKWDDIVAALKDHQPTDSLSLSLSFVPVFNNREGCEAQRPLTEQFLQEAWNNKNLINPGEVAAAGMQPEGQGTVQPEEGTEQVVQCLNLMNRDTDNA